MAIPANKMFQSILHQAWYSYVKYMPHDNYYGAALALARAYSPVHP